MPPGTMLGATPILLTANIDETVTFMAAMLGFHCRYRQEGMAILVRDAVELMYTSCPHQQCIDFSCCRIQVQDIDAYHAEVAAKTPIDPRGALRSTDYGTREFGVLDRHGALMTFFSKTH
jgi:hypothetical protein